MAKKCIPGVICVENMTLFILVLLSISVGYLYYKHSFSFDQPKESRSSRPYSSAVDTGLAQSLYVQHHTIDVPPHTINVPPHTINVPPLNTIDVRGPVQLPVGIPVNIRTSTANTSYRQIGILTKSVRNGANGDPLILPLFGRNLLNGRDKWQYYTVANSGGVAFNAKLPISVNGRSCTSEYGCDSVSNGDTVYVEGYDDTFRATIYENATLNYIPY